MSRAPPYISDRSVSRQRVEIGSADETARSDGLRRNAPCYGWRHCSVWRWPRSPAESLAISPRVGYQPPPVTHLPATQLRLEIQISSQYEAYGGSPNALILIHVYEQSSGKVVSLPASSLLTCNGVEIQPLTSGSDYSCRRQPPGGTYRLAYTDEHGVKATVVVPVPAGSFAILAPRDGARVPIPTNGTFTVQYSAPVPPADGSVAIDNITAACSVSDAQPCGAVYAKLQPTATRNAGPGSRRRHRSAVRRRLEKRHPDAGQNADAWPTPNAGANSVAGQHPAADYTGHTRGDSHRGCDTEWRYRTQSC